MLLKKNRSKSVISVLLAVILMASMAITVFAAGSFEVAEAGESTYASEYDDITVKVGGVTIYDTTCKTITIGADAGDVALRGVTVDSVIIANGCTVKLEAGSEIKEIKVASASTNNVVIEIAEKLGECPIVIESAAAPVIIIGEAKVVVVESDKAKVSLEGATVESVQIKGEGVELNLTDKSNVTEVLVYEEAGQAVVNLEAQSTIRVVAAETNVEVNAEDGAKLAAVVAADPTIVTGTVPDYVITSDTPIVNDQASIPGAIQVTVVGNDDPDPVVQYAIQIACLNYMGYEGAFPNVQIDKGNVLPYSSTMVDGYTIYWYTKTAEGLYVPYDPSTAITSNLNLVAYVAKNIDGKDNTPFLIGTDADLETYLTGDAYYGVATVDALGLSADASSISTYVVKDKYLDMNGNAINPASGTQYEGGVGCIEIGQGYVDHEVTKDEIAAWGEMDRWDCSDYDMPEGSTWTDLFIREYGADATWYVSSYDKVPVDFTALNGTFVAENGWTEAFRINDGSNFTLENCTVTSPAVPQYSANELIQLWAVDAAVTGTEIHLKDCTFENGQLTLSYCGDAVIDIDNCRFVVSQGDYATAIELEDYVSYNKDKVTDATANVSITNSEFVSDTGADRGYQTYVINVDSIYDYPETIVIDGCTFVIDNDYTGTQYPVYVRDLKTASNPGSDVTVTDSTAVVNGVESSPVIAP